MKKLLLFLLLASPAFGQALNQGLKATPSNPTTSLYLPITSGDLTSLLGTYQFPAATLALVANTTNYIYVDLTQNPPALIVNQTGFPSASYYPIAIAVTNTKGITSLTDSRPNFNTSFGGGGGGGSMTWPACTGLTSYPGGSVWGTCYTVGIGSSNIVQLTAAGALPAVSAANLFGFPTLNQNTTGTAANLSGTPALPNGTSATTQTAGDSSTDLATDSFVSTAVSNGVSAAVPTGTRYGVGYYGSTTALTNTTPPAAQGSYVCGYTVPSAAAVAPTCPQTGLGVRAIIGSTNTDTIAFTDNLGVVEHDSGSTACVTTSGGENLPTPTTLGNTLFAFSYSNHNPTCIDTITPAGGYTIQGNSTLSVNPNIFCRVSVDPNSVANWLADCTTAGTSGSGSTPFTTLTDAATINWSVSGASSNAEVTLGGNRSLSISGASNGWKGTLLVSQDGTGSRTLSLPSGFYVSGGGAGAISLTATAHAIDKVDMTYDGTNFYVTAPFLNYTAAGGGGATFTLVETVTAESNTTCGTAVTASLGTNTTSGEMIALSYWGGAGGTAMTITDSGSESYTKAWERTGISSHYTSGFAYFLTTASGISSVSVSGGGNGACGLVVQHWKRSAGSWAVDQTGGALSTAQASPWSSPTVTTTVTNELLLGGALGKFSSGSNCTLTATGSWTGHSSANDNSGNLTILENQTVTSIQTNIAATGTIGGCTPVGAFPGIVTFK